MALGQKAFAVELEVATSQTYLSKKETDALDGQFEDVYIELQPTPQDYQARKVAVDFMNGLARDKLSVGDFRKHYGVCNARAFGSFTMDMFTPTSDLDISLNLECGSEALTRDERVKLLKKLTKLLYGLQSNGLVREIQPVFKAKVPVVKFMHCNTGIECDVSVENRDGIVKSEFLRIFSSIDSRFRKLCFLVCVSLLTEFVFQTYLLDFGSSLVLYMLGKVWLFMHACSGLTKELQSLSIAYTFFFRGFIERTLANALTIRRQLKAWANAHGINSSKDHTLNSLSIILLVAFHLQTRVPAILPPFSMLLKGLDSTMASHAVSFVEHEANIYKGFGKNNNESVVQLFNSFLTKIMAVKELWHEGLCASAYEGTWTLTTNPSWIFVEDITSRSQNAARAVNGGGFDAIYECCNQAFIQLKSYFLGAHEAQSLKSLLFNPQKNSAAYKRKRQELNNYQPRQSFMVQQSVAEDRRILSYAPSSKFYDSRRGQMIVNHANVPGRDYLAHPSINSYLVPTVQTPGQMIVNHSNVPGRDYLARPSINSALVPTVNAGIRMIVNHSNVPGRDYLAHPSINSALVPTVNTGMLSEHPAKRMKLQHPIIGSRYFSATTDMRPLPDGLSTEPYQGYPERLSRDDQIFHSRKLQSVGQGPYVLPDSRIGMYEQRHLLGERAAEQTYTGTHHMLPPPFTNDRTPLYSQSLKDFNQGTYPSQVPPYGYGFKMHNQ